MVSENVVVMCDPKGIHSYHIPELSSAGSLTLEPAWEWEEEAAWSGGSLYTASPQCTVLYLQELSATHTLVFRTDTPGGDPMIAEHRISEGPPAYLGHLELEDHYQLVVKGRKGLYWRDPQGGLVLNTCLVGTEELPGQFDVEVGLSDGDIWGDHIIELVDFDERTGRIAIGTIWYEDSNNDRSEATCIYLADLPP